MTEGSQLIRGLEGVVAAETRLCDLDGRNGRLAYGGYDIDELARQATFEDVATCSGTTSYPPGLPAIDSRRSWRPRGPFPTR
jgi:citrate synthase